MKKTFYSIATMSMIFTGCLKDDNFDDYKTGFQSSNNDRFVAVLNAFETSGLHTTDLFTTPAEEEVAAFTVSLTGPSYNKDVQLTISTAPTLLDDHNENNAEQFVALPAANFELPASITIPAGKSYVVVKVKLKKTGLDPVVPYALALQVATVNDPSVKIASNTRQSLLGIVFRNDYDGVYRLRGYAFHPLRPEFVGSRTPLDVSLTTTGVNSVEANTSFPWANGVVIGAGYEPTFTIDPTTKEVTVSNAHGVGFQNAPGYPSRYDPATKTIYAKWQYSGGGGNRVFTDTLVYFKPRN